jgi:anti-sigma B factor antagonist
MSSNGHGSLAITAERTGTTVRIIVSGDLDLATAPDLRACLYGQLADHAEIVVLDLADLSFIDSSGLHVLLQTVNQDGGRLRILPSAACLRLFDLAGVRDLLPLIDADRSA